MKLLLCILMAVVLFSCGSGGDKAYFVSPNGDDSNPGTFEQPFKSVEQAKNVISKLSTREKKCNITVFLRGGTYQVDKTIVFGLDNSAPDGFVYSFEKWKDEQPVLSSGIPVVEWKRCTTFPNGTPEAAKGKMWEADFPEGISKFYVMFAGNRRIDRARKEGFEILPMKPIDFNVKSSQIDKNKAYKASKSMNVYDDEDRFQLKQFHFKDPQKILKNWDNIEEIEVGFAPVPWAMNILPLEKIDFKNNVGFLSIEANAPPGAKLSHTQPWIENAIDYLAEGTFVTSDKNKKIYYWPKGTIPEGNLVVPALKELIKVEGEVDYEGSTDIPVKNLKFSGITFTHTDRYSWKDDHKGWGIQHDWDKFDNGNAMLRFRGAKKCVVEGCRFTNSGNSAIRLDLYCQDIRIENNLIDYVGHMGILLCGYGPGTKDVNKHNYIGNNLIHHVGQVITHGAGVFVWQSGENTIEHNLIHHVPRKGVGLCGVRMPILEKKWCDFDEGSKTIRWAEIEKDQKKRNIVEATSLGERWKQLLPYLHARNNIVQNNEVYRALEYLADGSVLNVSGAGEGNIVRNNYVHHIASHASGVLRTDDWQRGTTFENNIIYMANISGIVHKGYNHILNNKLIDCSVKEYIRFASYPDEEADYGSLIQKNIFYESGKKVNYYRESYRASEGISLPPNCKTNQNIFWCKEKSSDAEKHVSQWNKSDIETESVAVDPKFLGMEQEGFRLDPNSPAFALGFNEIDFKEIGLKKNYPADYLKLDVPDDGRKANFHRNKKDAESLYDFW
ncbi:right-handed parallel beta-helix repeat-containing protein [Puteibacter caeruleilacunae]|nr:right-handed parallel beta-helix repeat-containing protein [Puteibacter caeruleilacunae]